MAISSTVSKYLCMTFLPARRYAFLTFKTLFNTSLPGWLLIFLLLTPLRLNSCSSDSKTNLPKYTTLHSTSPTLLETLASSLTNILLLLTKLLLSPKLVTITFLFVCKDVVTDVLHCPVYLILRSINSYCQLSYSIIVAVPSTSFQYQFLHFLLTHSFTHHFILFWFTTLLIHNSLSLSLPA